MRVESKNNRARYRAATSPNAGAIEHLPKHGRETHGLYRLKRGVTVLGERGLRAIDGRTAIGKALLRWRLELVRDLGSDVSTQQAALIDLAMKTRLMLDSIDGWLLAQPSLVNKRKRALLPVVTQRQQLADALARYLDMLGLERRSSEVFDVAAEVARQRREEGGASHART